MSSHYSTGITIKKSQVRWGIITPALLSVLLSMPTQGHADLLNKSLDYEGNFWQRPPKTTIKNMKKNCRIYFKHSANPAWLTNPLFKGLILDFPMTPMRSVVKILMTRTLPMAHQTLTMAINTEEISSDKIRDMIREHNRVVIMGKPRDPHIRPIPIMAGILPGIPMLIRKVKVTTTPPIPTRGIPKANHMDKIKEAIRLITITAGTRRQANRVEAMAKIRTRDTTPIQIMAIIRPAILINTVRHREGTRQTTPI